MLRRFACSSAGAASGGALLQTRDNTSASRHGIYDLYVSSDGGPSEDRLSFRLYRSDGGTGTDVFESPLSYPATPSNTRARGFPFSVQPPEDGTTPNVIVFGMATRLSYQWSAEPSREFWSAANSGSGFTLRNESNPGGKALNATMFWIE